MHTSPDVTTPAVRSQAPQAVGASALERGGTRLAKYTEGLIVLTAAIIATIGFLASEKIGLNNGLGWDGAIYAEWVADFPGALDEGIDAYRIQRILPAAVAHYVLKPFKSDIKAKHVIRAFGAINIICTTLVALFWCRIAAELKIGDAGKWLGFAGFVLNFSMTKHAFFNPVLTDSTAMAISTAMCYCYLRGWQLRLLVAIAAGAFTWPTLIYIGAVLVLFPRRPELDTQVGPAPRQLNVSLAGLMTFYVGLWTVYVLRDVQGAVFGFLAPIEEVLPLAVCFHLIYLFCGLRPLLASDRLFQMRRYWTSGNALAAAALVTSLAAIKLIQAESSVRPGYMGLKTYLLLLGIEPVAKPGISFVSAATFFGPLVIVAIFVWQPVCRLIHQHGLGLTLAVIVGLLHTVDSESRHFNYLVPLVFPFVVKAIEPLKWSRAQYGFVVALAAISTKSWLVIKGQFHDNAFMYPDQLYTMHWGPFMGTDMYLVHLGAVAAAALALYLVCFQCGKRRAASETKAVVRVRNAAIRPRRARAVTHWDEQTGTTAS